MVEWDLPNWLTLVTEVIVGIIIAIIVYRTTKKYEKQNKDTLKKIQEIEFEQSSLIKDIKPIIEKQAKKIDEQTIFHDQQKDTTFNEIKKDVHEIQKFLNSINKILMLMKTKSNDPELLADFNSNIKSAKSRYSDLQDVMSRYATFFEPKMYSLINKQCNRALSLLTQLETDRDLQVIDPLQLSLLDILNNINDAKKN